MSFKFERNATRKKKYAHILEIRWTCDQSKMLTGITQKPVNDAA